MDVPRRQEPYVWALVVISHTVGLGRKGPVEGGAERGQEMGWGQRAHLGDVMGGWIHSHSGLKPASTGTSWLSGFDGAILIPTAAMVL